ncbi:MAG: DUF2085 domain-containing protein [Ignavibacteriales bacterium]|nr:DUF2085 domain-containing protein [Ignavibacteriales bacterium]
MNFSYKVYSALFLLTAAWCAGIVAAPFLRTLDLSVLSSLLYSIYSHVCHQFDSRSFHVGGEPLGVCIRCTAIYGGFVLSLAAYPFLRRQHRSVAPSPWILAVFLAPMAADVFLNLSGLMNSTNLSRLLSGISCGLALPYYLVPPLTEAIHQIAHSRGGWFHARETR